MATDLYTPCPCGSGKKFKWCCQPIHVQMDKAFRQEAEGQHDAALRTMDEIIAAHSANPEPLGRKAQILYDLGKTEEAEDTLQKALDLNPRYPFGHLLRGLFRRHEGEVVGALLQFRKAADLYDPEATTMIARVYELIGESELKLNRPVAARAALQIVLRCLPNDAENAQAFEEVFGSQSRLPEAARREYAFQSPPASANPARRAAWDQALTLSEVPRLTDLAAAFEKLTSEDAEDAAAWYNLGVARAWLGENRTALEALDNYVTRELDEGRAGAAWALGEVLRCGHDMEDQADYIEYSFLYQVRDLQRLIGLLGQWEQEQRLAGVQVSEEQGILSGLVLEAVNALTAESAANQLPRLAAQLLILGGRLSLSNSNAAALEKVRKELEQRAGPTLSAPQARRDAVPFHEVLSEAVVIPVGIREEADAKQRMADSMSHFFEDTWIHRPLRSLSQIPPVDAAGHASLRRKLIGVVQFLEQCAAPGGYAYDFNGLRRKLGLMATAPTASQGPGGPDIAAMNAAELSGLSADALTDEQAEQAYQTALKLDARDLAGVFARSLVSRPPNPGRSDRYPWYGHLVQLALTEGNTDAALDYLNEGEKADCEQNEGRRRNDYEQRRGQILARRGEADQAQDVFDRLIARLPSELRYRGTAAEAMLAARQGARALAFAEAGLAKAREKNERDSEEYFKELVSAAKRVSG
jgi:tetratricopeptide (TPR) repeat protein